MDLNEIRSEIDKIDDELVRLFCQRMHAAAQVADYKKANNLPIFQPARERAKLQDVAEKAGPEMANYTRVLYSMLFELSRSYQSKRNGECSPPLPEHHAGHRAYAEAFPAGAHGRLSGRGGRLLPDRL